MRKGDVVIAAFCVVFVSVIVFCIIHESRLDTRLGNVAVSLDRTADAAFSDREDEIAVELRKIGDRVREIRRALAAKEAR